MEVYKIIIFYYFYIYTNLNTKDFDKCRHYFMNIKLIKKINLHKKTFNLEQYPKVCIRKERKNITIYNLKRSFKVTIMCQQQLPVNKELNSKR